MGSFIGTKLNTLVMEIIRDKLSLNDDRLNTTHWNAEVRKLFEFCVNNGYVTADEVTVAVRKRIKTIGRTGFQMHIHKREYPDHVVSPEALAFAIRFGELSEHEIGTIKFDNGDTPTTFYPHIDETFVQKVVDQVYEKRT